jgi:DNA-directed RNA polymerase specialized sigma24 family protein
LPDTTTPAGREDYLRRLLAVREDPRVTRLALARAGDRELAEDALQQAFDAMARIKDPGRIEDLKAYFCRVLIHVISALRNQLGAILPDDFALLANARRGEGRDEALPRPLEEAVATSLLARGWLERLTTDREALASGAPGRSPDPRRYRELIVGVAGQVLQSIVIGDVCDADVNSALRAAYPEWFATDGGTADNAYQRLSRARADVRTVLRAIINRDDLYP